MLPEYLGAAPAAFRFTIPGIVRSVLSDPSLEVWCGSDRVHMHPLAIDADTFPSWVERLWAPDRQLPFILVVSNRDGALPVDSIQELCRAAMGMANVYVMDGSDKHLMCDIVKPYFGRNTPYHDFRISDGFVRVYPGGIDRRTRQDALRCRFYFSSQIEHDFEFESQLFKEINRSICGASYRGPDDVVDLDDIARKDAKLRVRILTERSEQLKRKLNEVRETSREHVRSDDAADEMKYLDSENAKLRNALGEWEQLACSYSEQVDALSVENNDLMSQVAALASECSRKAGWLPPSKADGANAPLLGMRHVPSCLLDLLDLVAASWPDRVVVLEDARRSAGRFRCDLDDAWAILRSIPTVLWDLSFNGAVGDIEEAYRTEAGYTLARTETRVTKDNPQMMRERTHTYDGREVIMLAHIKGRSKNPKKAFRVYYFPDSARKMIVIGHCGGHLTTDGTRRKGF